MRTPQRFALAEYKNDGEVGAGCGDGRSSSNANEGAPYVAQQSDQVDMLIRMVGKGQMN